MQLVSKPYEIDDVWAIQELYHGNGWADGLPTVPPVPEAVQACLEWAMMAPEQLLGNEPVRGVPITAEKLAVNAVMAGYLPMHFPVVVTAFLRRKMRANLRHYSIFGGNYALFIPKQLRDHPQSACRILLRQRFVMAFQVLNHTNETAPPLGQPAPRPAALVGKTVGVISNAKEGTRPSSRISTVCCGTSSASVFSFSR